MGKLLTFPTIWNLVLEIKSDTDMTVTLKNFPEEELDKLLDLLKQNK
jgi:hypothetical protein